MTKKKKMTKLTNSNSEKHMLELEIEVAQQHLTTALRCVEESSIPYRIGSIAPEADKLLLEMVLDQQYMLKVLSALDKAKVPYRLTSCLPEEVKEAAPVYVPTPYWVYPSWWEAPWYTQSPVIFPSTYPSTTITLPPSITITDGTGSAAGSAGPGGYPASWFTQDLGSSGGVAPATTRVVSLSQLAEPWSFTQTSMSPPS